MRLSLVDFIINFHRAIGSVHQRCMEPTALRLEKVSNLGWHIERGAYFSHRHANENLIWHFISKMGGNILAAALNQAYNYNGTCSGHLLISERHILDRTRANNSGNARGTYEFLTWVKINVVAGAQVVRNLLNRLTRYKCKYESVILWPVVR